MIAIHCLQLSDEVQWKMQTQLNIGESCITDQIWKKLLLFLRHSYRTCPKREKLSVKDTFFVLKTAELSWLSVHFIHTARQEEPVELVCFYSAHKEPVFIMHQNMSPYLVSFWVCRGSPPLHQSSVWKTLCCFALCCLFKKQYTISLESPWIT